MKLLAKNEGTIDRVLRVVLGVLLLSLTVVGPQTMWGLLGLVPLLTGLVGTCPLYTLLGVGSTYGRGNISKPFMGGEFLPSGGSCCGLEHRRFGVKSFGYCEQSRRKNIDD